MGTEELCVENYEGSNEVKEVQSRSVETGDSECEGCIGTWTSPNASIPNHSRLEWTNSKKNPCSELNVERLARAGLFSLQNLIHG